MLHRVDIVERMVAEGLSDMFINRVLGQFEQPLMQDLLELWINARDDVEMSLCLDDIKEVIDL